MALDAMLQLAPLELTPPPPKRSPGAWLAGGHYPAYERALHGDPSGPDQPPRTLDLCATAYGEARGEATPDARRLSRIRNRALWHPRWRGCRCIKIAAPCGI